MYRRGDGALKKRFSKISIHSLGFRIFVLLAIMIVLFCALVAYNNTAAFGLLLERIHENSENTLVLYQKSLDENLSRTETYLYVFALNDADLLSLRVAEPQTTSWYVTLNGKYYLVRILNLNGYLLGAYISTDTLLGTLVDTKTQDSLLYFSNGSLLLRTPSSDVRLEAPRLKWRRYPSYDIDETS